MVKVWNSLSSAVYSRTLSSAAGSSIVMKPTSANQMAARSFIDTNVLIYAKASAQLAGCSVLFSEHMNPGETMTGVRIINPFA